MSRLAVALDFFRMEKEGAPKPQLKPKKLLHRRRSFRDIQSVISKMNPQLLKTVIASGSVENVNLLAANPKIEDQSPVQALPLLSISAFGNNVSETTPLTIFYKGTISVFDVSRYKAEDILKLAEEKDSKTVVSVSSSIYDLPLTRRKSLERFLQKRKERLTSASPYGYGGPTDHAFPCMQDSFGN